MIEIHRGLCYNQSTMADTVSAVRYTIFRRRYHMKHIQTLNGATLKQSAAKGGCGECQTSCQSACKTSCTVANLKCENQ